MPRPKLPCSQPSQPSTVPQVTYLSPLAYLLGLEGAALLRGLKEGSGDQAFVEARIAEIRTLLADPALAASPGVEAVPGGISTAEVYRQWAPTYDEPNSMIEFEEPYLHAIIADLPIGTALDAACGTGRYAAHLSELGHRVIGVDASPDMLAIAAGKVPGAVFHRAELTSIPLPESSIDLAVCALALCHLPDLVPVFAEFARVLRPGGHLVISDPHVLHSYLRPTLPRTRTPTDSPPPSPNTTEASATTSPPHSPPASRSATAPSPTTAPRNPPQPLYPPSSPARTPHDSAGNCSPGYPRRSQP